MHGSGGQRGRRADLCDAAGGITFGRSTGSRSFDEKLTFRSNVGLGSSFSSRGDGICWHFVPCSSNLSMRRTCRPTSLTDFACLDSCILVSKVKVCKSMLVANPFILTSAFARTLISTSALPLAAASIRKKTSTFLMSMPRAVRYALKRCCPARSLNCPWQMLDVSEHPSRLQKRSISDCASCTSFRWCSITKDSRSGWASFSAFSTKVDVTMFHTDIVKRPTNTRNTPATSCELCSSGR
mmetsp:Transcript_1640/g.3768  ORF Transcript_1640/g.3768 Transcript_1640/m.3768 type:complete len:240 (+) Transcript_1640:148-867(+)